MSKSGGTQETTTKAKPWSASIPYLRGLDGTTGVLKEAEGQYQDQQFIGTSAEQQALIQQEIARTQGLQAPGATTALGQQMMGGQYDPNLSGIGLDMGQQYAGMGSLDPTGALQQQLSGQVNMGAIGDMQGAYSDRAMQDYQRAADLASRQFTEQINPAIGQGAQMAGQFGGSRHGIAQGIAMRDIGEQFATGAENLAETSAGYGKELYGNAYQDAMARQASTGQFLGQQAQNVGQYQTGLDWQSAMLDPQIAMQNQLAGAQTLGAGEAGAGGQFQSLYGLQGTGLDEQRAAQQFEQDQLARYTDITTGVGGLGGTSVGTAPGGASSPLLGALGGGMTGLGLAGAMGGSASGTAMLGAIPGGGWTLAGGAALLGALGS